MQATPIAELSERQPEAVVDLQGTVSDRAPLVEGGVYLLEDETGEIWVLSRESLPESGVTLQVNGVLRDREILINATDYGEVYLEERDRQVVKP